MKNTIFVDCFNTVILRKKSPDDVLFLWGQEMHKIFSGISAIKFYEMFKNGENEIARYKKTLTGEREYTLQNIFEEVLRKIEFYGLVPSQNLANFFELATSAYNKVETENQYLHQKVWKKLQKLKNQGAKIFVVSDFYCPSSTLQNWLEKLCKTPNFFDGIFVSCECLASKRTGALYDYVAQKLGVDKQNIQMIGDNIWSDVISARRRKISAKWIFKPYKHKSPELKSYKHKLVVPQEYQELFKQNGKNYGYSNYAFPMYIATKRLAENLQRKNAKDVFFLAREGFFLKQLFDYYAKLHNLNIKSHYLELARGSVMTASLKPLQEEDFSFIFNSAVMVSAKSFLCSMSFSKEQIEEILQNVQKPNLLHKNFAKSKAFLALKASKVFQKHYENMRLDQKEAFQKYLLSFGVDFQKDGVNIVDVGWKGTMQNMLKKFFAGQGQDVDITGFYVGYFQTKILPKNKKAGLLYSKILSPVWAESRVYRYRMRDYEQLLRAPKNRTVSYAHSAPFVCYDQTRDEKTFHEKVVQPLQTQIFEKFQKICELDPKIFANIDSISAKIYYKIIKNISLKDYKFMNACQNQHYDSFGYVGHTLKFDVKFFKWLYFRFMDMLYLTYSAPLVFRKKIYWH